MHAEASYHHSLDRSHSHAKPSHALSPLARSRRSSTRPCRRFTAARGALLTDDNPVNAAQLPSTAATAPPESRGAAHTHILAGSTLPTGRSRRTLLGSKHPTPPVGHLPVLHGIGGVPALTSCAARAGGRSPVSTALGSPPRLARRSAQLTPELQRAYDWLDLTYDWHDCALALAITASSAGVIAIWSARSQSRRARCLCRCSTRALLSSTS